MFIYSVRASTIKFFTVIGLTLAVLIGLVAAGGNQSAVYASSSSVDFSGVKTNEDRIAFISQFGIKVAGEPVETESFSVPENFDRIIAGYNEIQKAQGLDITKYRNKRVTRYTYEAEGYGDDGKSVYVNLIIYRGTVIACDISSTSPDGFVKPLVKL